MSDRHGQTPQQRHDEYLRLATLAQCEADKDVNAWSRDHLLAIANSWRILAAHTGRRYENWND